MKQYKRIIWLAAVLFVVFPLIYAAHLVLSPKPGTGEDLVPQSDLHFVLTEQKMEKDDLIVTVRNTGGSTWTEKDWIRAAILIDGQDTGVRAHMKPGETVKVGDTVTFVFGDIRSSLTDQSQVGMVQETIAYFPEMYPIVVR